MKRSEIRVGETYGVQTDISGRWEPVAAKVVALDQPYDCQERQYSRSTVARKDGVLVEFVKPVRISNDGISLASPRGGIKQVVLGSGATGAGTGERYRFGKVPVGRFFVGVWSELEQARKENEEYARSAADEGQRRADEFAPRLAEVKAAIEAIGGEFKIHGDASGVYGTFDLGLYRTGTYGAHRPVGFAFGTQELIELIEFAAANGFRLGAAREEVGAGDFPAGAAGVVGSPAGRSERTRGDVCGAGVVRVGAGALPRGADGSAPAHRRHDGDGGAGARG